MACLRKQRVEHRRRRHRLPGRPIQCPDVSIGTSDVEANLEARLYSTQLLERLPVVQVQHVRPQQRATERVGDDAQALGFGNVLGVSIKDRRLRGGDVPQRGVVSLEERR